MDFFGIGSAIKSVLSIYFHLAEQTGRTTNLVESVQDGDRVVFADARDAKRVSLLCKERGVTIEPLVVSPERMYEISSYGTAQGRLIFDHVWLEAYYLLVMESAMGKLLSMKQNGSGSKT